MERLYHPDKYKRISCDKLRCNKSEICAFFHSTKEKNLANKLCKNYRKAIVGQPVPNINQLHESLQQFYLMEAEKHSQHIQEVITSSQDPGSAVDKKDVEH